MSSHSSAPSAPPPDGGDNESRLHIRGIKEMPAGHDEELAIIFKEMGRATGLSREQIAGQLATSAETIAGLESGAVLALPESSELKRIVTAYAALLGLDARPILRRLEAQIDITQPLVTPSPAPAAPPAPPASPASATMAPPGGLPMPPSAAPTAPPQPPQQDPLPQPPGQAAPPQAPRAAPGPQPAPDAAAAQPLSGAPPRETDKQHKRGRLAGILRPVLNWMILLGFVAALGAGVWYAAKNPRVVWSAFDNLPEPIPRLMRSAWELVRPLENTKPRPQITDPDNRKSDKLR